MILHLSQKNLASEPSALSDWVFGKTMKDLQDHPDFSNPFQLEFCKEKTNILNCCDFHAEDQVLEIFSQYGVLTSAISPQVKHIDSIEPSSEACHIQSILNSDLKNVDLYDVAILDFQPSRKYDHIFLIGNFERCLSLFEDAEHLFLYLKKMLRPGGKLWIAYHNPYAIRYFAGERSEKNYFATIEQPAELSASAIKTKIQNAGFQSTFYYPLPDYEFSTVVYSENYLPKYGELANIRRNLRFPRYVLFNEEKALNEAIKNHHFETFTNSYLILCE